jgi:N-acetylmuramoyl-L-alanine amidase
VSRPASDEERRLRQQMVRRVVADNEPGGPAAPPAPAGAALRRPRALPRAAALLARHRGAAAAAAGLSLILVAIGWWRLQPARPPSPAAGIVTEPSGDAAELAPPGAPSALSLTTTHLRPIGAEVLGLGVRRIVLDPGHGGSDTGTTVGGLLEKDLTLDISARLREKLEQDGFEVHMTRTGDVVLNLRERSDLANLLNADLFVSVHINYLPGGRQTRGVETYFVGATEDPELIELARRENAHSGYDMASNNQLLQKLFADARQHNSQAFARRVQQTLFSSLKRDSPGLVDRGVKQAPFVVLVGTTMPAILAEVACLSNPQDIELLARPLYRESIATALARGIRGYADDVNSSQEKGS